MVDWSFSPFLIKKLHDEYLGEKNTVDQKNCHLPNIAYHVNRCVHKSQLTFPYSKAFIYFWFLNRQKLMETHSWYVKYTKHWKNYWQKGSRQWLAATTVSSKYPETLGRDLEQRIGICFAQPEDIQIKGHSHCQQGHHCIFKDKWEKGKHDYTATGKPERR